MKTQLVWIVGGLFAFFAGCAPTLLPDGQHTAVRPPLNNADYGEVQLESKGEILNVKLMLPPSDVCVGQFKLKEMKKSYPFLSFMGDKALIYSGQWNEGQSQKCIAALEGPGGAVREISIQEENLLGQRNMTICTAEPSTTMCTRARNYGIKK